MGLVLNTALLLSWFVVGWLVEPDDGCSTGFIDPGRQAEAAKEDATSYPGQEDLGGNADLYVLVDPCDDDTVEYVSVGSTRLIVIQEVTC